jgi:hypothetical protein
MGMKKFAVLVFVVLMTSSLAGAEEFRTSGESGHFDHLMRIYEAASLPTESEIAGVWSGRCYEPGSGTPSGWVLAAKTVIFTPSNSAESGPLFQPAGPVRTFNIGVINHGGLSEKANRYDNLSQRDLKELQNYMGGEEFFRNLASQVLTGALVSRNVAGNSEFRTRVFQGSFVTKVLVLADAGELKAGESAAACYFFKKIAQ